MNLAKVLGTVVATHKESSLKGLKFLLRGQVDQEGESTGTSLVAVDAVGAGEGEYVLYASGSSARMTEVSENRPCDAVVMAIVDSWEIGGERRYKKYEDD